MPAHHVFLSYSRKDGDFFQRLRTHLKPWDDQGLLDVWTDERIHASQDWHAEIQQALAQTAVAVLLVSADFLASTYIREYELPPLLRAREADMLDLTCLYLKPSTVSDEAGAVVVDGERIRLTQYAGLNDPRCPLSGLTEHERETVYADAATTIKALLQRRVPQAQRTVSGKRYDLTVQFTRRGAQLQRHYWHQYVRLSEYRSAEPTGGSPDPFTLLFGTQAQCDTVLQRLFDVTAARPLLHAVRVRLQTTDPWLAAQLWAQMTWETQRLHEHGWTFQLVPDAPPGTTHVWPDITLRTPCPVLLLTPSHAPQVDVHHRAWEERLHRAWPSYHEAPQWVHTWDSFQDAWQRRRPPIVYYYGPAELAGEQLLLHFDGPGGQVERRPVTDLAQVWGDAPPTVLFCNALNGAQPAGLALAQMPGPLRIVQTSHDATAARRAALAWLQAVLEGGDAVDPVAMLHQHALPTAVAWTAYGTWHTRPIEAPVQQMRVRLTLDRRKQKDRGERAVRELVREPHQRLACLLAYGANGNLIKEFPAQLCNHVQQETRAVARVVKVPMRLPQEAMFDLHALGRDVCRYLGMTDLHELGTALSQRKPPAGPRAAQLVLFLDWGVRGASLGQPLRLEALIAWVMLCSQVFCSQCPQDVRLLACLSLEVPVAQHEAVREAMAALHAHPSVADRAFQFHVLEPLDLVDTEDLSRFFKGSTDFAFPDDLLAHLPELIVRQTGGHFEATVALLEEAERTSWYDLHDELVAAFGRPTGPTPPSGLVL